MHYFNLSKLTGYVLHQQFNIQKLYSLSTLYLCIYLRTKQDLLYITSIDWFYNRDDKCLLRGTNWFFK
jgi:hypothetical protein